MSFCLQIITSVRTWEFIKAFSTREFAIFSNEWDFQHTTSSPYHSQSNGKAESSVKLAKKLLKRAADSQLALFVYRNTITAGMTTNPIHRLLHRSTRSIIPQLDCGGTDDKLNRGYGHVSSNKHFWRIVHHKFHISMVSPLCGYGHVSSNHHFVRIVHHRYHICMVFPQCG